MKNNTIKERQNPPNHNMISLWNNEMDNVYVVQKYNKIFVLSVEEKSSFAHRS